MIHGTTNSVITFGLTLAQGEINQYPQVKIYDAHENLDATVNLSHVADGFYNGVWTPNTSEWHYGNAIIYTDAGHSVESTVYGRRGVVIKIDEVETNINDIETDTNELQTDWTDGGRLDLILDDILLDTGTTLPATLTTIEGKVDTIDGIVDAILVDTNELQTDWTNGGRLDLILDDILLDTGTTIPATLTTIEGKIDTVDTVVDAILVDTNELQADWTNGGRLDVILDAILADTATIVWGNVTDILADTNELQTDWTNGGRLDTILDTINTNTDDLESGVLRILGLSHENVYIDTTVYDAWGNLSSARLRTYNVAGSVGTGADVLATYTITAAGTGTGKFTTWKQVKV